MFDFVGLLALVLLFLVIGLRRRVGRLESRLAALEAGTVLPAEPTTRAPSPSPFAPRPQAETAPAADAPPPAPPRDRAPAAAGSTDRATASAAGESVPSGGAGTAPKEAGKAGRGLAGFEERFGALWTVWLGGLALALGGIFLVRYAIEADLIGPGARIALGALLAAVLLGGGEWLRRSDKRLGAGLPFADVPAMVSAAGICTAYAVIYAAYELYALLPPAVAFALLGIVAVGSMLAALLHGPVLAALGLVGAGVAPLLISTDRPSAWGLAIYIAVVAAAALGVARVRLWLWLAMLAVVGAFLWGLVLLILPAEAASAAPLGFLAAALAALTAALLVPGLLRGPQAATVPRPDLLATLGFGAALLLGALLTVKADQGAASLVLFTILALGVIAAAWKAEAALVAPLVAVPASGFVLAAWDVLAAGGSTIAAPGPLDGLLAGPPVIDVAGFSIFGVVMAGAFGLAGFLGAGRAERALNALLWSALAVAGPLLLLVAAYWRLAGFAISLPFAVLALGLAALATGAVARLSLRDGAASYASGVFAAGAVGALGLGLAMALEKGWLTVGFALTALGIAWVWSLRPLPGLRALSALAGLAVLGRVVWDPTIAGGDPGPTPVFNWLLWGYGVPALAFAAAAWRLGGSDWARRVHEALCLMFAVMLAVTEIRHAIYGDLLSGQTGLAEAGALLCVALAYAIALEHLRRASTSPVYRFGALAALAAALGLALWVLTIENPLLFGPRVGGRFVNLLLIAYALPAVLAAALLATARGRRGPWHRRVCGALALLLGLAYVTLEVRRLFVGPRMSGADPSGAELYAYSAAWLGFGIALLAAGLVSRSRDLRLASALIVMLTVLKVFLWDMSDLEGVLRALSFIGLGLVLVAIGWLYQHLLVRRPAPPEEPPAESPQAG